MNEPLDVLLEDSGEERVLELLVFDEEAAAQAENLGDNPHGVEALRSSDER